MADFLRPEARAALWRWREALSGAALAVFGFWWGVGAASLVQWIGWAVVALGIALALAGIQRARFRTGAGGPGIVQIDERRLSYFGPLTGGIIDMDDLTRLELDPKGLPAPHWILSGEGGQRVAIPITATGADSLFDLFASLPGIRTAQMLAALEDQPTARITIWDRPPAQLN